MDRNNIFLRSFVLALIASFVGVLAWAILFTPPAAGEFPGLQEKVSAQLSRSGVTHPVTAVLLNFRGYDTLLELGVLLLILIGVWSLGRADTPATEPPESQLVLHETTRVIIPLFIIVVGYLLWVGAAAPGGAFQAGALLGAAGVMLTLSGLSLPETLRHIAKTSFVLGLSVFVSVGIGTFVTKGLFLQYPETWAKVLILLIEFVATLSIGATLAALYLGGRPVVVRSETKNGETHP